MRKNMLLMAGLLLLNLGLLAQHQMDVVLSEVVRNNTYLKAFQQQTDAEKIGNKTDLFPENPEIGFDYLWSTPTDIGNRTDFSITQSIDFPTVYGLKRQVGKIKDEQLATAYERELKELMLHTKQVCLDLIFTNASISELQEREKQSNQLAEAYNTRLKVGETNVLEYNKVQLNLLNIKQDRSALELEREQLLMQLKSLNGDSALTFSETNFPLLQLPSDFEQWFAEAVQKNPHLKWIDMEINRSNAEAKLNKSLSLPKLQAGYMSESIIGEQFKGFTMGLTVPLWENSNKVKYAQAQANAMQSVAADQMIQAHNTLKNMYLKAVGLNQNVENYRQQLKTFDNTVLLKKALEKGEISLINYLLECTFYYESIDKLIALELELHQTVVKLNEYL